MPPVTWLCVCVCWLENTTSLAYLSFIFCLYCFIKSWFVLFFSTHCLFSSYACRTNCLIFHPHFANKFIWNVVMSWILSSSCKYADVASLENVNGGRAVQWDGFCLFCWYYETCLTTRESSWFCKAWVRIGKLPTMPRYPTSTKFCVCPFS